MIPQVTAYCWGDDPIEVLPARRAGALSLTSSRSAQLPFTCSSVSTSKLFGQIGGFELTVHGHPGAPDLLDILADGDWIDVSWKGLTEITTMRGVVRRRVPTQIAEGPSWTLYGDDHTGVWDQTTLWWNPIACEDLGGGLTMANLLSAVREGGATPAAMVRVFLERFFQDMEVRGRALGSLPPGMPRVGRNFVDSVKFITDESVLPRRVAFAPHGISFADENLWACAQDWADPQFVELHTDLVHPTGRLLRPTDDQSPANVSLGVIVRDRVHPTDADPTGQAPSGVAPGQASASPFWRLPLHQVYRDTEVVREATATNAEERINVVSMQPPFGNGIPQFAVAGVLYDPTSMRKHGFRRLNGESQYVAQAIGNVASIAKACRVALRDWYAPAAYLLSGQIGLASCRPEIRCGDRVRVSSGRGGQPTTYYVEGVFNRYDGRRSTTDLTVTRGWRGTDQSYLAFLRSLQPLWKDTVDTMVGDFNLSAEGLV